MAIPILENIAAIWRHLPVLREAATSLSDHEGPRGQVGWTRFGAGDDISGVDRYTLMKEAYKAYRKDPRARNIIETYASYVLGDGYFVKFEDAEERERWLRFVGENRFDEKFPDAVRMTLAQGNHFFLLFPGEDIPQIRHLSATQVGKIETAEGDPEKVLRYIGRDQYYKEEWPADRLIHMRVLTFGQLWGHTILEPILTGLARKRSLENSQSVLLKILASLPIIRKGPWTTEQITSRKNDFAALPPPGAVITVNNKEDWTVPNHPATQMNWRDQGRSLDLSIAAGAGLPYFMVFEDSGDTNYAASLVAEAPAMRRFKEIQSSFAYSLKQIVKRVIEPESGFEVGFYPIVPRDAQKEVRAWMEPAILRYISWRTAMEKLGIDPEAEEERMRAEGLWPPGGMVDQASMGGFQWRNPTKDVERNLMKKTLGKE